MGPIPRCPARTDRSSRGASPHALSSCHLRSGVNGAETRRPHNPHRAQRSLRARSTKAGAETPATPVAPETARVEAGERAIRSFPRFRSRRGERPACSHPALALYDLGKGTAQTRGRGAPLALRIFVEAVLSVPLHDRTLNRPVAPPRQRFGDLLKALYPNPGFYRRSRHFAAIYEAAKSLESARVPWEHPDGSGAMRRVVYARDLPRDGRLDDWVQFVVDLPPGSERGVLVDRTALRKAGVESASSYRLALSLAFWWHDPGKMRTPTQRGGKGRGKLWRQTRQVERYPVVTDAELIAMTYPSEANNVGSTRRSRLQRSRCVGVKGSRGLQYKRARSAVPASSRGCLTPGRSCPGLIKGFSTALLKSGLAVPRGC